MCAGRTERAATRPHGQTTGARQDPGLPDSGSAEDPGYYLVLRSGVGGRLIAGAFAARSAAEAFLGSLPARLRHTAELRRVTVDGAAASEPAEPRGAVDEAAPADGAPVPR